MSTLVLPGSERSHMFAGGRRSPPPDDVVVSAVDRTGNESGMVTAGTAPAAIAPSLQSRLKPKTRPAKKAGRKKGS